jgi:hypothetical protein
MKPKGKWSRRFSCCVSAGVFALSAQGQEWLDKIDDALHVQTPNGFVRAELSGLLDLEGYYIDSEPPGLLFPDDTFFFNPRLSLFLDTQIGEHLYSLVQVRFDRGFDPGARPDGDIRLDEYFVRYKPLERPVINLQVGKFATVVGNWVHRHLSWDNPFINAPIPYENVFTVSDLNAPPGAAGFLGRRDRVDQKADWLPIIWGPSYAAGVSIFGAVQRFDYAVEIKNASLSSRPTDWNPKEVQWQHPTVSGRVGVRPNAAWSVGANASYGSYLRDGAERSLPAGTGRGDYTQMTVGPDITFAWRKLELYSEAFASRFEVPNVGDVETLAYYLEAKYQITSGLFGAVRWNQQFFDEIANPAGGETRWDRDLWRVDSALGYRFTRHLQAKLQYSYTHENGFTQGEQLIAGQFTVKF